MKVVKQTRWILELLARSSFEPDVQDSDEGSFHEEDLEQLSADAKALLAGATSGDDGEDFDDGDDELDPEDDEEEVDDEDDGLDSELDDEEEDDEDEDDEDDELELEIALPSHIVTVQEALAYLDAAENAGAPLFDSQEYQIVGISRQDTIKVLI